MERPWCAGSARCSSTPFRSWPARTSSWPPGDSVPWAGQGGKARPTGDPRARRRSSTGPTLPACCRLQDWPAYTFKRRQGSWPRAGAGTAWRKRTSPAREVLARLRDDGPLTANQLGGGEEGRAVVGLVRDQDRRRVAARHRPAGLPRAARLRHRLRPGRARGIPSELLGAGLERRGVRGAAGGGSRSRARRGACLSDLAKYHGLPPGPWCGRVLDFVRVDREVSVAGWAQSAYADPGTLDAAGTRDPRAGDRAAVPVRLAHLVPGAARSGSSTCGHRLEAYTAEGEARLRLLRHAPAGRRRSSWAASTRPGRAAR